MKPAFLALTTTDRGCLRCGSDYLAHKPNLECPAGGNMIELAFVNLPPLEEVADQVHNAWMQAKQANGITSRLSEKGEELMQPYNQLSEDSKELDRVLVRTVYAAIQACSIRKAEEG